MALEGLEGLEREMAKNANRIALVSAWMDEAMRCTGNTHNTRRIHRQNPGSILSLLLFVSPTRKSLAQPCTPASEVTVRCARVNALPNGATSDWLRVSRGIETRELSHVEVV